jgi:N-acetylglucosamine kinase-like BadF-type ATPase
MGIDLGGTSTRAELVDGTGEVLGVGLAEGANLRSAGSGIPGAARAVRRAAELALAQAGRARDAERVFPSVGAPEAKGTLAEVETAGAVARASSRQRLPEVIVVAASGAGAARHKEVASAFREALAGICDRVHVENDLAAAFRSASSGGDGYLLLSGTGAVAARYRNGLLERRADGLGWILGDAGSGLWIGWQCLRAAAADLDGRGPAHRAHRSDHRGPRGARGHRRSVPGPGAAGGRAGPGADGRAGAPGAGLGGNRRGGRRDRQAGGAGAAHQPRRGEADGAIDRRRPAGSRSADRELVLAGGVLAHPTPVRDAVVTELESRGSWRVVTAADPVVGALRIARELAS